MASRAFTARLSNASSSSAGSASTAGRPGGRRSSARISPRSAWRSNAPAPSCSQVSSSIRSGRSDWRRATVSSRLVSSPPRCAARRTLSASCARRAGSWTRSIRVRPLSTTCSRLLKSCATPPVSCPTASSFCAWRSRASSRLRSVTSRAAASTRATRPSASRSGVSVVSNVADGDRNGKGPLKPCPAPSSTQRCRCSSRSAAPAASITASSPCPAASSDASPALRAAAGFRLSMVNRPSGPAATMNNGSGKPSKIARDWASLSVSATVRSRTRSSSPAVRSRTASCRPLRGGRSARC